MGMPLFYIVYVRRPPQSVSAAYRKGPQYALSVLGPRRWHHSENRKSTCTLRAKKPHLNPYKNVWLYGARFVLTPLASNASELLSSLRFAARKRPRAISLTLSQIYGAVRCPQGRGRVCLCSAHDHVSTLVTA